MNIAVRSRSYTTDAPAVPLSHRAFPSLAWLTLLLVAAYVTWARRGFLLDDAYITYRYAYNLATGHGMVYNHGEAFLGTTAPGYALLLGVLGILNPYAIPSISIALSGLSLFACAAALLALGSAYGRPGWGLIAGLALAANPLTGDFISMETLPQMALILWAFERYDARRNGAAGALMGLAVLTRPDGVLALAALLLLALISERRLPRRALISFVIVVLPGALAAWAAYGTPLPGTLSAKLAHGATDYWPLFWEELSNYLAKASPGGLWSHLFPPLLLLGLFAILPRFPFTLGPIVWVLLHTIVYSGLSIPFYHWYGAPAVLFVAILIACGATQAVEEARRLLGKRGVVAACAVLVAMLCGGAVAPLVREAHRAQTPRDREMALLARVARELEGRSTRGVSLGYCEIGYLGYCAPGLRIVDTLGLVNPEVARNLRYCTMYWALQEMRPEYVFYCERNAAMMGMPLLKPWFREGYRAERTYLLDGMPFLTVYARRDIAPLPSVRAVTGQVNVAGALK